ncbi:hypothetical protein [Tardiphaga sp. OK245]|uniref:hypothetical protein n=1 Tax=Tardiphaga sp. OK245 TaxID=1855306 RepID=UPI0008A7246E|nr:hypothetical protein [Tardiphaga sp. OK245]SEI22559.1 hypothetical protein SAMN05216367_5580 [Tardiphaga sp. OK245]
MGQAKIRREALRLELLSKCSEWDFPASAWEADLCSELREQDVLLVPRASAEQLAWARMPANQCHANARWYEKNDPTGNARAVVGWWVQWPNFVLHSIIETKGQLICITPSSIKEMKIPFIRDPKISWVEDGDVYSAIRNDHVIGHGVRMFPAYTAAQTAVFRDRLLAGIDPFIATYFTDQELEDLKERYITAREQ